MIAQAFSKVTNLAPRYRVVVCGRGVLIEGAEDGDFFTGFVACRFVRARSADEAIALVRRDLLIEWNNSYNRNRAVGVPRLTMELVERIASPFKSDRGLEGYRFFSCEDEGSRFVTETIVASAGWF